MRRFAFALALIALAPIAFGQEGESDPDAPAGQRVFGEALGERTAACMLAEGSPVSPEDRTVLADATAALGPSVARATCGDDAGESAAAQSRCLTRLREIPCDELASRLASPARAAAPPPAWAEGYARTLAQRLDACAAQEQEAGSLGDEDRAALAQFESGMASALGAMAATGACAADENALPACARSVAALSCDGLGARLVDDPGALARAVTPECAAMLRCGAAALDDAGAEAPDDADPLAVR